jgi:cytochrome c2
VKRSRLLAVAIFAASAAFAAGAGGCSSTPLRPGDAVAGRDYFENRCSHCHSLPEPAEYDRVEWRGIIRKMGPQAGLDRQMQEDTFAWIEQHCAGSASR